MVNSDEQRYIIHHALQKLKKMRNLVENNATQLLNDKYYLLNWYGLLKRAAEFCNNPFL